MTDAKTWKKLSLKAEWREIVTLNFDVDRRVLQEYVPQGTQLDSYNEHAYVTLIAKNIRELQPYGGRLTLFRSLEYVGLRFYVKRKVGDEYHRGFCNLRSFVSGKWAARLMKYLFPQTYEATTINRTATGFEDARSDIMPTADYRWLMGESDNHFKVKARSEVRKHTVDSKEEFIFHHRYMFVSTKKGTVEYAIRQAPWMVWDAASGAFDCDTRHLLGEPFRRYLKNRPSSVLLSRGGDITFARGEMIS